MYENAPIIAAFEGSNRAHEIGPTVTPTLTDQSALPQSDERAFYLIDRKPGFGSTSPW
jgi:hypothetical protein